MAVNRLARWVNRLSCYGYTIEYRQTQKHVNSDVLSSLPQGPDTESDKNEGKNDFDIMFYIVNN